MGFSSSGGNAGSDGKSSAFSAPASRRLFLFLKEENYDASMECALGVNPRNTDTESRPECDRSARLRLRPT